MPRPLPRWLGRLALLGALGAAPAAGGSLPAEVDRPYVGDGTLALGDLRLRLEGQRLLLPDGQVLVEGLLGDPVSDGAHLCASDEGDGGRGRLRCWDRGLHVVTLATGGRPGRLALDPAMLAWVASPTGLPQVTVAPVDGSAPARALTNVDLQRVPGRAPAGFVPPPLGRSLRFDGDLLRWDTPDGPRELRWR